MSWRIPLYFWHRHDKDCYIERFHRMLTIWEHIRNIKRVSRKVTTWKEAKQESYFTPLTSVPTITLDDFVINLRRILPEEDKTYRVLVYLCTYIHTHMYHYPFLFSPRSKRLAKGFRDRCHRLRFNY
jgi:hypothetical protein